MIARLPVDMIASFGDFSGGIIPQNASIDIALQSLSDSILTKANSSLATTTVGGLMSAVDKIKLDSIAAGATLNSTDAALRARSSHTGTQAISTITNLQTTLNNKASKDLSDMIGIASAADPNFENSGSAAWKINQLLMINPTPTNADAFDFRVMRRGVAGGEYGWVNAAFIVDTTTHADSVCFEWSFLSKMDNYSNDGQNVAGYFQAHKYAMGSTFGMTVEAIDPREIANPTTNLIGCEFDIRANGTDDNNQRVVIDVVASRLGSSGADMTGFTGADMVCSAGIAFQNANDTDHSKFNRLIWGRQCRATWGIDFRDMIIESAAMALDLYTPIVWGDAASKRFYHDGTGFVFADGATINHRLNDDGTTFHRT